MRLLKLTLLPAASVAAASALTWVLWPHVRPSPSPLFFLAVMTSTLFGGLASGLVATAASTMSIALIFVAEPGLPFDTAKDDAFRLIAFAAVSLFTSSMVTKRNRAEAYLRSIVTTAVDAIITIDTQGVIHTFNPAAERMFGYSAAEAAGQNVRLLMPQLYGDEHDGYLDRYLKTGEARIIGAGREVVGLRKDGTTFPLELSVGKMDHLERFTGVLRDLSDRRQLEWALAEAQIDERRHIAQELHDNVGGDMTGIGLLAQSLQSQLVKAQSPLADKAQDLVTTIGEAHKKLRSAIRGLMPVDAMPEGLMVALANLARQTEAVHHVSCQVECEKPVHLGDPSVAKHLFRIVQEAVNNAVRHGKPACITISLGQVDDRLEIVVADDGRGMENTSERHDGIGLESMRHRARLLSADLIIQSREGGGTTIVCRVPLPAIAAGRESRAHLGRSLNAKR